MIRDFLIRWGVAVILILLSAWGILVFAPVVGLPNLSWSEANGVTALGWVFGAVVYGYHKGFED